MSPTSIAGRTLLLVMLFVCLSGLRQRACGQDFQSLTPPRPNRIYQPVTLPRPHVADLASIPLHAHALAVRVMQDGKIIRGNRSFHGVLRTITPFLVSLKPDSGSNISIGFALRSGMRLRNEVAKDVILKVNDVSSPFGVDQEILIRDQTSPYAWFVWQSRREPIVLSLPDSIGLIRQHPYGDTVRIMAEGGSVLMGSGLPRTFTAGGRSYTAYLQTALLQTPSWKREGDGSQKMYIVRGIVVLNQ